MFLLLPEVNCTFLKERLKSGQNFIENQPVRTPEGVISNQIESTLMNTPEKGLRLLS